VQLTEIVELTGAGSATIGCFGSELHSTTFPIDEAVKPLPVIVTDWPLLRPVFGVTVMGTLALPAANADPVLATMVSPTTMSAAAPTARTLERAGTVCGTESVNACLDKSHPH